MDELDPGKQLDSFLANGFLGPFKVYEPDEAVKMWRQIRAELTYKKSKVYDPNPYHYDRHLDIDLLSDHVVHPEIVKRLRWILGQDILCWRTEVFSKKPGASGTEWHQVRNFAYANEKVPQLVAADESEWGIVLTAWTAWSECTRENGCMKFLAGSHRESFFDENRDFSTDFDPVKNSGFYGYRFADLKKDPNWQPDENAAVFMEMVPGEVVLFTTRCVHGSTSNTTENSTRYSTNARYVKTSTRIFPGMTEVSDHGNSYDLTNYSAVLVSGSDSYGHNRLGAENLNGKPFKIHGQDL